MLSALLLVLSFVCFVLATLGVAVGGVALVPLGLALMAASMLVPA